MSKIMWKPALFRSGWPWVVATLLMALATGPAQGKGQGPKAARKAPRTIRLPATIEASEEARLHGRVEGYVRKVQADIGDQVQEGQVLVEMAAPKWEGELKEKQARLQEAHAELEQAKQGVRLAETEVAAVKAPEEGAATARPSEAKVKVAEARVDMAVAAVRVAEARLDVAKAEVEGAASLLQEATLRAPFDGVVVQRSANPGEFVTPAEGSRAEPLLTVMKVDLVRVVVQVPEEFASSVGKGTPARIEIPYLPGQKLGGQVTRTGGALSSEKRTLRAEMDLPNRDGKLLPGMEGSVTLTLGHGSE